ncbi:hypothetical protein BURK_004747 [Burkholderia sp. SJ98]|nr:hypothetical protein BURK_004747 [Burkholderia sp. SJ98]
MARGAGKRDVLRQSEVGAIEAVDIDTIQTQAVGNEPLSVVRESQRVRVLDSWQPTLYIAVRGSRKTRLLLNEFATMSDLLSGVGVK